MSQEQQVTGNRGSGASAEADQALVCDQAAARLAPSGFDPSRVQGDEYRLSNGLRVHIGKFVGEAEHGNVALLERFIAAGHSLAVADWLDDKGLVDVFFTSGGYCNGPGCSACRDSVCWHCQPNYQPESCIGDSGYAAKERDARHLKFLELKAEFEPASATEARRAETAKTGSVHDGAVPKADAQTPTGEPK